MEFDIRRNIMQGQLVAVLGSIVPVTRLFLCSALLVMVPVRVLRSCA
jgi:hypothetical protein